MKTYKSHLDYLLVIFKERKKSIEYSIDCNEKRNDALMTKYFKGKLDNIDDVIENIEWVIENDEKIHVENQLFTKRKRVSSLDVKHLHHLPDYLQNKRVQVSKELIINELSLSFKSSNEYPHPSIFSDGHYDECSYCSWFIDGVEYNEHNSSHEEVLKILNNIIDEDKSTIVEVEYSDGCC